MVKLFFLFACVLSIWMCFLELQCSELSGARVETYTKVTYNQTSGTVIPMFFSSKATGWIYVFEKVTCLFFRGSKDGQELWGAPHLQNFYFEVCQCLHAHCLFGLFQGQVKEWLLTAFFVHCHVKSIQSNVESFKCCFFWSDLLYNMTWLCLAHRLVGRPGNYLYVVGSYRMEEVIHIKHSSALLSMSTNFI